jgi:hypothetical protein
MAAAVAEAVAYFPLSAAAAKAVAYFPLSAAAAAVVAYIPLSAAAAAVVAYIPLSAAAAAYIWLSAAAYIPLSAADTHHCSVDTDGTVDGVDFHQGLPDLDTLDPREKHLIILDDLMDETDQRVASLFTKKSHHRNISVM